MVGLPDILERLGQVSDLAILLIDACRSRFPGDQGIPDLSNTFLKSEPIAQLANNMRAIGEFTSGIFGPQPLLFASEDAVEARVVPYRIETRELFIGPLAVRLDQLFDQCFRDKVDLTLRDFIQRMQKPDVKASAEQQVRAYTGLREDFMAQLPDRMLLSATSRVFADRAEPFAVKGPAPADVGPSGCKVKLLHFEGLKNPTDFAWDFKRKVVLVTEKGRGLSLWGPKSPAQEPDQIPFGVMEKKCGIKTEETGVEFGGAMVTAPQGGFYVYDGGADLLFFVDAKGSIKEILPEAHLKLLGPGAGDEGVIATSDDVTEGTKDEVFRITPAGKRLFSDKLDVTGMDDILEWPLGNLVYCVAGAGGVLQYGKSGTRSLAQGLEEPSLLTATRDHLYALSRSCEWLYRIDLQRNVLRVSLKELGFGGAFSRPFGYRGFQALNDRLLVVNAGPVLVALDITDARWHAANS